MDLESEVIAKFMPFLAALATARGSVEMECEDVRGVCDVEHSRGLFRAVLFGEFGQPDQCGNEPH